MKFIVHLTSLAVLILALGLPASAALAQTKIAFVTSETTDGSIDEPGFATGIASADAICQRLALASTLTNVVAAASAGGFKAWLSDSSASPSTSFVQATVPYVSVHGTQIADNWSDLTDALLASPLNLDQNGSPAAAVVFTGTTSSGGATNFNCSSWTSLFLFGSLGFTFFADSNWTNASETGCINLLPFYCFQQGSVPVELQSFSID